MRRLVAWLFALALSLAALPALAQHAHDDALAARDVALSIPAVPADYATVQLGPLAVSYPRAMRPVFADALGRAERDARAVGTPMGMPELPRLSVRLVPDDAALRALSPPEMPPPRYASGVAYPSIGLTLVSARAPVTGDATRVAQVLRHELSHLAWGVATGQAAGPRWFTEGLAVEQSGEHSFERFQSMAQASFSRGLAPWAQLDARFGGSAEQVDVAYAQGADIVGWLLRRDGPGRFAVLAERLRDGDAFPVAMRTAFGASLAGLEEEWRADVRSRFALAPLWAGSGVVTVVFLAMMGAASLRRWRRSAKTRARWAAEERARRQPPRWVVVTPGMRGE
ncbi:MAG: hypothetical protein Q8S73_22565 [Deltaproteobacteria bacterium]|nr:hypothetical protein [Myxococcales bacterium]MDP3216911.1 hypothetical protein [Deltaproteobacteria bacterium]